MNMDTDIYKAEPMDVYVDANGKLWRVVGCWEGVKVVTVEEVEKDGDGAKARLTAGAMGLNFAGFKRIFWYREHQSHK